MQKLISELSRLYLPAGASSFMALEQQLLGKTTVSASLVSDDGLTRAIVIGFHKVSDGEEAQHWSLLCAVAKALQLELGLPAPAVSISGKDGFNLWLSLAAATPVAQVQRFLGLLRTAYYPDLAAGAEGGAPVELPPCLHPGTGRWAAFIHPGLGASFADESGLEMAPPFAGQAALLEGLQSTSQVQFQHAMHILAQSGEVTPVAGGPVTVRASSPNGLLLQDATLEEIVSYLHSKNIEPTFRHLIRKP
jgi:hypothetical protein